MTLIVDSYAWVEFLSGGSRGPYVRTFFESPQTLITPDIVLAEVARVLGRAGLSNQEIEGHLRSIGALSSVLPVDVRISLEAIPSDLELRQRAKAERLEPPGLADALILACARVNGARVLTGDRHFRGLPDTEWTGT